MERKFNLLRWSSAFLQPRLNYSFSGEGMITGWVCLVDDGRDGVINKDGGNYSHPPMLHLHTPLFDDELRAGAACQKLDAVGELLH